MINCIYYLDSFSSIEDIFSLKIPTLQINNDLNPSFSINLEPITNFFMHLSPLI